jgi:hypothetical protein
MEVPDEPRGPSISSATMPFIITSNMQKADHATRKLIRSHVMRGKKQKRGRRDKGQQKAGGKIMPGRIQAGRVKPEEVIEMYTPMLPGRVGSDLSVIEFAAEIEPSTLQNMIRGSYVRPLTCDG